MREFKFGSALLEDPPQRDNHVVVGIKNLLSFIIDFHLTVACWNWFEGVEQCFFQWYWVRGLDAPSLRFCTGEFGVVYGGDNPRRKVRLLAGEIEIHPYIGHPLPFKPLEFSIPPNAIPQGELTLTWFGEPGLGGNGRGCQVSEVWLVKEQ